MIIMIISLFKILGDFFSFFACVFVRFFFPSFKKIKIEQNCPKLKRKNFNAQSALFTIISYFKNQYVAISQIFCEFFHQKSVPCNFPDYFASFFVNNQNIAISQI
eukprot:04253.XXX_203511_203822_1 [CDS] Oithona nana genome sequencing.